MASAKEKHWKSPIVCAFVFPFYVSTDLLVLSLIQMIPAIRQYRVPQRWTWQNIVIESIRTIFTSHFPDIKPIKICCCVAYVQRGSLIWQFKWGRAYFLYQVLGDPVSPFCWTNSFLISAACIPILFPLYLHYCIVGSIQWILYIYILYNYSPCRVFPCFLTFFGHAIWEMWGSHDHASGTPWPSKRVLALTAAIVCWVPMSLVIVRGCPKSGGVNLGMYIHLWVLVSN